MHLGKAPSTLLKKYLDGGMQFGDFISLEDSSAFAKASRSAARLAKPGLLLDLGCGTGIPTIHACQGRHFGLGIDSDVGAVQLAAANATIARHEKIVFVKADMMDAHGRFSLVMSNPPYIPTNSVTPDRALEVLGDGAGIVCNILSGYRASCDDFVMHFASLSNPQRILHLAHALQLRIVQIELTVAPFGRYTSEPKRLAHLLACKERGEAIFFTGDAEDSVASFRQLLMSVHFTAALAPSMTADDSEQLGALLQAFGHSGTPALVNAPPTLGSIKIRAQRHI